MPSSSRKRSALRVCGGRCGGYHKITGRDTLARVSRDLNRQVAATPDSGSERYRSDHECCLSERWENASHDVKPEFAMISLFMRFRFHKVRIGGWNSNASQADMLRCRRSRKARYVARMCLGAIFADVCDMSNGDMQATCAPRNCRRGAVTPSRSSSRRPCNFVKFRNRTCRGSGPRLQLALHLCIFLG